MDLNNPATPAHRQGHDASSPSGSSSHRVSTVLLNLSGESTQETMLLRCERIETGLNELRGVLGSLRKTCTLLETQAEKLGSEIAEMKDIVRSQYNHPTRESSTRTGTKSRETTPMEQLQSMIVTPPASPLPIRRTTRKAVRRLDVSSAPKSILGKKRPLESSENTREDLDESTLSAQRNLKRVRFANVDDIPVSHVRTPMHQLNTSSQGFILPIPVLRYSPPRDVEGTSIDDPSPGLPLVQRNPDLSPPAGGIHHEGPVHSKNETTHSPSRRKTKWDPSTGKRVPIPNAPNPTSGDTTKEEEVRGAMADPLNYEHRLVAGLSSTSLG